MEEQLLAVALVLEVAVHGDVDRGGSVALEDRHGSRGRLVVAAGGGSVVLRRKVDGQVGVRGAVEGEQIGQRRVAGVPFDDGRLGHRQDRIRDGRQVVVDDLARRVGLARVPGQAEVEDFAFPSSRRSPWITTSIDAARSPDRIVRVPDVAS